MTPEAPESPKEPAASDECSPVLKSMVHQRYVLEDQPLQEVVRYVSEHGFALT